MKIKENIKRLLTFKSSILAQYGLEKALLNSFGAKALAALFGPLQIFLIMRYFSAELQGYYYTFSSLLAFQILLELGLGSIVTYFASHEWGALKYVEGIGIVGDEKALKRLVSFGRLVFKWYFLVAFLLFVALSLGGLYFFDLKEMVLVSWRKQWVLISLINSLIFMFIPVWALLEGCSQQNKVAYYRFIYSLIWGSVNCLCIFLGANLWVNSISLGFCLLWNIYFLRTRFFAFFKTFFNNRLIIKIPWKKEVLPMQWKIALSSVSLFFIFSLFNPIIFRFFGSVTAGKVGLIFFLGGVIVNFSTIYLNAYLPQFGTLLAQKKILEREALFFRVFWITVLLCLILSSGLIVLTHLGRSLGFYIFKARMLSSPFLEYFVVGYFLCCISIPFSAYLRSYKKEPLLINYLLTAVLMTSSLFFFSFQHNFEAIAISFMIIQGLSLSWTVLLWRNYRRKELFLKGRQQNLFL